MHERAVELAGEEVAILIFYVGERKDISLLLCLIRNQDRLICSQSHLRKLQQTLQLNRKSKKSQSIEAITHVRPFLFDYCFRNCLNCITFHQHQS